jgi:hypothetical protein
MMGMVMMKANRRITIISIREVILISLLSLSEIRLVLLFLLTRLLYFE